MHMETKETKEELIKKINIELEEGSPQMALFVYKIIISYEKYKKGLLD